MDNQHEHNRRTALRLTNDEFERIVQRAAEIATERAAERAIEIAEERFHVSIGKAVVRGFLWICGAICLSVYGLLQVKGLMK